MICSFCSGEFKSLGRHVWRGKENVTIVLLQKQVMDKSKTFGCLEFQTSLGL